MSSIDDFTVRRHCHRSSVIQVERIARLYAARVAEDAIRVHIPLVPLMLKKGFLREQVHFWYRDLFHLKKSCRNLMFEAQQKDTLCFCVYASFPSYKLRSHFSTMTQSTAQWSKPFIIMLRLPNQNISPSPTLIPKVKVKCNLLCLSVVITPALLLLWGFQSLRKYCAIVLHIITAD